MPSNESTPRTLTQMLRDWDDDSLAHLLRLRPELAFPAPAAFSELAARATTRHAITDALNDLNTVELAAAEAAAIVPTPFTGADLVAWVGAEPDSDEANGVHEAVGALRRRALVWGSDAALRPVRVLVAAMEADETLTADARRHPLNPPDLTGESVQKPTLVDKAAAGSAFEFVRRIEVLVEHSDHRPVRLTQAGRLAVRDVRALGQLLDVEPALAQSLLEFAHAAGFVGLTATGLDEAVAPTDRFDEWRDGELAAQWRTLADTWLTHHLGSGPPEMKSLLVAAYGDPAAGRALSPEALRSWLAWHRPRRAAWARLIPTFVWQAAALGFTGFGALASFATEPDAASLGALFPERVDHVLLQADLTAIAPGPLRPDVAADFAAFADVESRGGATVFRFTRESLAQAFARGWSPDDIVDTLRRSSRTPVPQPLEYLVRDLERAPADLAATARRNVAIETADRERHHPTRRARPHDEDDLSPGDRLDDALAREIVRTLRVNDSDKAKGTEQGHFSESLGAAPLDTMREAVETQEVVWLGYVDRVGVRRELTAHLTSVDDGLVRGADAATDEAVSIPISRIVAAHIIRSTASH
jgi:Helicase conserved C-terminal domain